MGERRVFYFLFAHSLRSLESRSLFTCFKFHRRAGAKMRTGALPRSCRGKSIRRDGFCKKSIKKGTVFPAGRNDFSLFPTAAAAATVLHKSRLAINIRGPVLYDYLSPCETKSGECASFALRFYSANAPKRTACEYPECQRTIS